MKLKFESTVHIQRFALGVICGLLPILCVLFGFISCTIGGNPWELLYSISATYYTNHKIIMIGSLILCSFFLFSYQGYDLGDRIFTIAAGVGAFGVAAFPCRTTLSKTTEGLLSLPIGTCNILHYISAVLVFGSFTLMTLTQFTKGKNKRRNALYVICGMIMAIALALVPAKILLHWADWIMMLLELIMLEAFAIAWIVKSKAITMVTQ